MGQNADLVEGTLQDEEKAAVADLAESSAPPGADDVVALEEVVANSAALDFVTALEGSKLAFLHSIDTKGISCRSPRKQILDKARRKNIRRKATEISAWCLRPQGCLNLHPICFINYHETVLHELQGKSLRFWYRLELTFRIAGSSGT